MTREEKKEVRADRYRELAEKARNEALNECKRSDSYVEHIPFGQPILVGHHSEKRHRKAIERSWNAMDKSVKLREKADYYEQKAEKAENNDAIYTDDENAVEKLNAKIEALEKQHGLMKAANAIIRKKITNEEKINQLKELGLSEENAGEIIVPDQFKRIGFASYQLAYIKAEIKRCKDRQARISALQKMETKEYELNGVRIVENTEENRVQLFYDGKPDEATRKKLKEYGFRWSPSNGCWQSYLAQKWKLKYLFPQN